MLSRLWRGGFGRGTAVAAAVSVAAVMGALVAPATAADGDFDSTFGGGDGKVVSDFGFDDAAQSVAVQPDGRVVVAGTGCGGDFLVARYLADGSPDNSFSGNGAVCVDLGGAEQGETVIVLGDGRLLVAGTSGGDFAVVRLTSGGGLDPTFGTLGRAVYDLGGTEALRDADLAPDGKIVLTGETSGTGCAGIGPTPGQTTGSAVLRTTAEGAVDGSFGDGGKAVRISDSNVQRGHAAAVQPDGSVIVAGRVASCTRVAVDTLVYRLTPAGQPDPTFAGDAVVDSQAISAVDVALQADGKAVVLVDSFIGVATTPAHDDAFTVVRYDTAGHADPGFGTGGVALALFGSGSNATPRGLALQLDRIVAVGGVGDDSAVARFTPGGSPDGSFDGDGRLVTDLGGVDFLAAATVQADAKVVAAGRSGSDVAVVRIGTAGGPVTEPPTTLTPPTTATPPTTVSPPTTVAPPTVGNPFAFVCDLLRQLAAQPFLGFVRALLPRFGCHA